MPAENQLSWRRIIICSAQNQDCSPWNQHIFSADSCVDNLMHFQLSDRIWNVNRLSSPTTPPSASVMETVRNASYAAEMCHFSHGQHWSQYQQSQSLSGRGTRRKIPKRNNISFLTLSTADKIPEPKFNMVCQKINKNGLSDFASFCFNLTNSWSSPRL